MKHLLKQIVVLAAVAGGPAALAGDLAPKLLDVPDSIVAAPAPEPPAWPGGDDAGRTTPPGAVKQVRWTFVDAVTPAIRSLTALPRPAAQSRGAPRSARGSGAGRSVQRP